MEDGNSDDWLPPGWRMEVKLRKFGRKDKIYCAPYGKKFYSKLEVLRHLKNNLPTDTRLGERKNGCVSSPQAIRGNKGETTEATLYHGVVDACNNGDRSPASVENGKTSPDVSMYFSCNSMDSSSLASGEENQVIEQNVEILNGETPKAGCLLLEYGKHDTGEAAITIDGKCHANKLQGEQKGILYPSVENHCAKNLEEDSAPEEAQTFSQNQPSMGESGRAEQSSSIISLKRNSRHQNHARTKVLVEKCSAEGLPEGWTKEIKVKKKNGNVRRDPYYKDPVSGYVFRSMKDVLRYLKTGDIGRLAFKPKDSSEIESEDEETHSSPMKKQKLAETCSLDNKEVVEDLPEKVVVKPPSCLMEELSVPECARHESRGCSSKLSEAVQPEHSERRNSCSRKDFFSVIETEVISEEPLCKKRLRGNDECRAYPPAVTQLESTSEEGKSKDYGVYSHNNTHVEDIPEESLPSAEENKDTTPTSNVREKATRKPRKAKEINLPRRTSCRLAGISVDPRVEIPSRSSRGNAKHIGHEGPNQVKPEIQSTEVLRIGVDSNCTSSSKGTPDGNSGLISVPTHNVDNGSMEKKMAEKCVLPFELPSPEILQDPCIEFAIKTLTGMIDLNNLDHAFQPSNGMDSKSADRTGRNSETEKVGAILSPKKPTLSEEPAVKTIAEETTADMLSSSLGGPWSDPCIEFAIKTLTGAIPGDYNMGVKDFFRQEMHTQQMPGSSNELDLNSSVEEDHFCRTDVLRQHKQCQLGESNVHESRRWIESAGKCEPAEVLHKHRTPATSRHRGLPK